MPEKPTLNTIASLFNDLRPASGGTYKLYAINGQLSLFTKQDPPRLGIIVDTFNSSDINTGLTSERWNNLQAKLLTLIQKGLL